MKVNLKRSFEIKNYIIVYLQKTFSLGTIKVKNIKVYAYHGCLIEEGKIGSDYRIDLSIKAI